MMNDLRARIAQIVERDRARIANGERGAKLAAPTETLSTRRDPSGLAAGFPSVATRPGAPTPGGPRSAPLADSSPPFVVHEKRIALDDLGLEIVGRGACDPLLVAHLGLKGDPPERWQDVLFLDTETTGLSGALEERVGPFEESLREADATRGHIEQVDRRQLGMG